MSAHLRVGVCVCVETTSGTTAWVTATLAANVDLGAGSTITLSGLSTSRTPSDPVLPIRPLRVTLASGSVMAADPTDPTLAFTVPPTAGPAADVAYVGCDVVVANPNATAAAPAEVAEISTYSASTGAVRLATALARAVVGGAAYTVQSVAKRVLGGTAAWDATAGTLTLAVAAGQTMRANVSYAFAFALANPIAPQAGPAVSVAATAASGGTPALVAAVADTAGGGVMAVSVNRHGYRFAGPPPTFLASGWCTCGGAAALAGDIDDPLLYARRAGGGTLRPCLAAAVPSTAAAAFARAHGAVVEARRARGAVLAPRLADTPIPPAATGAAPPAVPALAQLRLEPARFAGRRIGQSTPYPGARNTLSATLACTAALTPGAVITLLSLGGADPVGAAPLGVVALSGAAAGRFAGAPDGDSATAAWDPRRGKLRLFTIASAIAWESLVFKWDVVNPPFARPAAQVQVEASGISGGAELFPLLTLTAGTGAPGWLAVPAAAMAYDPVAPPGVPGAAAGDAAPLLVRSPGFVLARAGQSSAWPCAGGNGACGARNTVTVTLCSNYWLSGLEGTRITLAGLTGARTADSGGSTRLLRDLTPADGAALVRDAGAAGLAAEGVSLAVGGRRLAACWSCAVVAPLGATALLVSDALHAVTVD